MSGVKTGAGPRSSSGSEDPATSGSPDPWVPYSERPEWADVEPLPQDDGPDPVVKIAYSEKFTDVYDYFRAIYESKEVSRRALDLTADAADLNPANYTVWHHRRYLLKALGKVGDKEASGRDLTEELAYVRDVIEEHPKNYQVWQHRRAVVEWLGDPSKELRFCEIILSEDPKNYHAWQHRQWAIQTFNLYEGELDYIERLLEDDICNNSAWNQRAFVVAHEAAHADDVGDGGGRLGGPLLDREMSFAREAIRKRPGNEAAWNYFRGLVDRCREAEVLSLRTACLEFCDELYGGKGVRSSYLLAAMVDLLEEGLEEQTPDREQLLKRARQLCQDLAGKYDVIRRDYWSFMDRDLAKRFG